jgi:hypothetical protein
MADAAKGTQQEQQKKDEKKEEKQYPPVHKKGNGPAIKVFDDVFQVRGSADLTHLPGKPTVGRVMTIIKDGDELHIINSIRVKPETEAEIEKLGKPAHVYKLGWNHGMDDPYWIEKYGAQFWAMPGMKGRMGVEPTKQLKEDSELPIKGSKFFNFKACVKELEGAIWMERHGGIAVVCDTLTNYENPWDGFGTGGRFIIKAIAGPPGSHLSALRKELVKAGGTANGFGEDIVRLCDMKFEMMLCAHGWPLKSKADQIVRKANEGLLKM